MRRFLRRHAILSWTVAAIAIAASVMACKPADPTSPNPPTSLTGQNTNEEATFNGTLTGFGGGSAPADGSTDVAVAVEVVDSQGNPAANLTSVVFSTTLGTIRGSNEDPLLAGSVATVTTWGGTATALLRSDEAGTAVVTAQIADKSARIVVEFEPTASTDRIALAFRQGADLTTVRGTTPFLETLVASVSDETGAPLAGETVRFRIVQNSASAHLTASATTVTDSLGEAFNVLRAQSVGTVSLVAELLDGSGNVIKESNQIIATITAESAQLDVSLAWSTGLTTTTTTAPATLDMSATVTDNLTGETLSGRRVRFRIRSDSAVAEPASLVQSQATLTNSAGIASNQLRVREAPSQVILEADLVDDSGALIAQSNQIFVTVTGEADRFKITLTFADGTTTIGASVPDTVGMLAEVVDTETDTTLSGREVVFRILRDTATATPAELANSGVTLTDGSGVASNAVTVSEAGSVVVVVADLLDLDGSVASTSNQVTIEGE